MDIRNSLDGLKSLLGVSPTTGTPAQSSPAPAVVPSALPSDSATLSNAGNTVASTAADSDVRAEKVASIQSALAAGTYNVSASQVASKMVDSMLGGR